MKKVIVPMAIYRDNPLIPIHGARPTYIEKLIKYQITPLFVTTLMKWSQIEEIYKLCQGAYFIGGDDFDPALYKQKKHPKTFIGEPERDILEIKLLKKILKDKKPFLGVCRGMQALAIASGGSLIQHLPDIFPKENHNPNKSYPDLLKSKKHQVNLKSESKTSKLIKKNKLMTTSYHHQAVKEAGNGMVVVGTSPQGVIEAIEHQDKNYFCLGVQCHPEAERNGDMEKIFKAFAIALDQAK